jgi:hypothetical protein
MLPDGFATEGYSGYDFKFRGNWAGFVSENNESAADYVEQHQFGGGYGYTLTTTSESKFTHLRDRIND